MDYYEREVKRREREDERRGYSVSSGGGWVSQVDHRHIDQTPTKRSDTPKVLDGFACLYGVKHRYKSRWEIFEKGCFEGSLGGVFFLIDHKFATRKLGDVDDGTLELVDNDVGLAFRLKLADGHLERLDGRDAMSCSYIEHDVETRNIDGDTVRVIKSASLFEVSACYVGSVRNTFAAVRNADAVGSLRDEVKNNFAMESTATIFMRALRNIAD
jgi:HK97 family phage prohead protease